MGVSNPAAAPARRPVTLPPVPAPPPVPPANVIGPAVGFEAPDVRIGSASSQAVVPPSASVRSGVQSEDKDAALRARMAQLKRRQARSWAWLKNIPGYSVVEEAWLNFAKVRDGDEELASDEQRKRELPAWLVSFVVHVSLLLILALIPLVGMTTTQLNVIIGDFDGEGATEYTLSPTGSDVSLQEIDLPMSNFVLNTPEVDLSMPAISPSLSAAKASDALADSLAGLSVEQGLAGRSGSMKGALLKKFGGNASTEAAVAAGLKWLAYNQQTDGGWSLKKNFSDGAGNEDRTGATAMALNAFLGAGHTHKSGEYKDVVDRGLKFLLRRQDKEGFFANNEPSHNQMYSQALSTITVCEAYGMTGDSTLRTPAARAIKFAEWSQGRQKGWRYEPRDDSDLSVTGWFLMALMTGRMAGLEPSDAVIKSVGEYVESVSHEYGSRYSYTRAHPPSLSMTAEGLLCRQYLGWPKSHPALKRAIETDLLTNIPSADAEVISVYYWYYATQVLHHVGGKPWEEWNNGMRVALPAMQVKKGPEAGSWDPHKDDFGTAGGRLYTTCFCIYCLEVYYRHLSLYDTQSATVRNEQP